MAYNSTYNPDALPAHAEPEQAAQILAGRSSSAEQPPQSISQPPPPLPASPYQPKHQPSLPPNVPPQNSYKRHSPSQSQTYNASGAPESYNTGATPGPYNQNASHSPYNHSGTHQPSNIQTQNLQRMTSPLQANPPNRPPLPARSPPQSQNHIQTHNQNHHPNQNQNHHQAYNQQAAPSTAGGRHPSLSTPLGSNSADASLFPLFKAVDKQGTGQLTESELRAALVNGDFTQFDPETVRMMIRMFDTDRSGTVNFEEFCSLWAFLAAWRGLFDRFDADGSGSISLEEYKGALVAFGYHLSDGFVRFSYRMWDKRGGGEMSFDLFVQSCISLKRLTDVFKRYDTDRDGYVTLSFEEYLTG